MASQVFSGGNTNFSYTNTTSQNVRVILNYVEVDTSNNGIQITFSNVTTSAELAKIGRNLAFYNQNRSYNGSIAANNTVPISGSDDSYEALPTELMLANGQSISIRPTGGSTLRSYNILIIPEAG